MTNEEKDMRKREELRNGEKNEDGVRREESCSTRSEGRMIGRRVEEKSLVLQNKTIAVTPTD